MNPRRLMCLTLTTLCRATRAALSNAPALAIRGHVFGSSFARARDANAEFNAQARAAPSDWTKPAAPPSRGADFPPKRPSQAGARRQRGSDSAPGMEIRAARLNGSRRRRGHTR